MTPKEHDMTTNEARKLFRWTKAPKTCNRCMGKGTVHTYGVCFKCGGTRVSGTERVREFSPGVSEEQKAEAIRLDDARLARNRERSQARRKASRGAA